MSRRFGANIPALCEIVERIGPCTSRQVYAATDVQPRPNVEKYCSRAVERGWMTVDRSEKHKRWSVVPGWRALVDAYNAVTIKDARPHRRTVLKPLAYVRPAKVHHLQAIWQSL